LRGNKTRYSEMGIKMRNKVKAIIFVLLMFTVVLFSGCIIASDIENDSDWTVEEYNSKLISITLGEKISGQFFLASGFISGRVYYIFLRETRNGAIRYERCPVSEALCCL